MKTKTPKKIIITEITQEAYNEIKALYDKYNLGEPKFKVGDKIKYMIK